MFRTIWAVSGILVLGEVFLLVDCTGDPTKEWEPLIGGMAPGNGEMTNDTTPTLTWNPVDGAVTYEVQIADTDLSSAAPVTIVDHSYTPATALTNGHTHYWRVRAVNAKGQVTAWGPTSSLLVSWGSINNMSPPNNTATTDTTPELSWDSVNGAVGYEVQIAATQEEMLLSKAISLQIHSYTPPTPLANNRKHYWRVRAVNADGGTTAWTPANILEVLWGSITDIDPPDGATAGDTTPMLSWALVDGAADYEVQIAETREEVVDAEVVLVTDPQYTPSPALANNKIHYWRVRARNGDGIQGAWCSICGLSVQQGSIFGMAPSEGTITYDSTPTLSWTAVDGGVNYNIQIGDTVNMPGPIDELVINTTTYTPNTALTVGQTHYWRVRTVYADDSTGEWSAMIPLSVHDGTISGMLPADGTISYKASPTLSWTAVSGAAGYNVQIADTMDMAGAVEVRESGNSYTPLLTVGQNYWRVQAVDRTGSPGDWSNPLSLMVTEGGVDSRTMKPADGASTTDTTPTLSWDEVDAMAAYQIQLADSESGLEYAAAVGVPQVQYTPLAVLENDRMHYWRVRAVDRAGVAGPWSEVSSLDVSWGDMGAMFPASGTGTYDTTPTLSWDAVTGAVDYQVKIDGSELEWQSGLSYTSAALSVDQTHSWSVRARNADNSLGAWSTALLRVDAGAMDPGGMRPPSDAITYDTTPALSWAAAANAAGYEVRIADSEQGLENAVPVPVNGRQHVPAVALAKGRHYWSVRPVAADESKGAWSSPVKLTVSDGAVDGMSPGDGKITYSTTPTLSWDDVLGADSYQVMIDGSIVSGWQNELSYTSPELTAGETYTWSVRAKDAYGSEGVWNTAIDLTVSDGVIPTIYPKKDIITYHLTPTLSWIPPAGAAAYNVEIDGTEMGWQTSRFYTPSKPWTIGNEYVWRVQARDAEAIEGGWSRSVKLTVSDGSISGMKPVNGAVIDSAQPNFSWNSVDAAVKYYVRISSSESGLNAAVDVPIIAPNHEYTWPKSLSRGKTLYWKVRAVGPDGSKGAWSSSASVSHGDSFLSFGSPPSDSYWKFQELVALGGVGTFSMGSANPNAGSHEKPVHSVNLSPYSIGIYEITNSQYAEVLNAALDNGWAVLAAGAVESVQEQPQVLLRFSDSSSRFDSLDGKLVVESGYESHPVTYVTWYGAAAFAHYLNELEGREQTYDLSGWSVDLTKAGYRLPTEAEWEYAARGGDASRGYHYSGSDTVDAVAWESSNSGGTTHPVGKKKENEIGIYDMSGNVSEWVNDWYDSDYYQDSPTNDPSGPESGVFRVLRGGGWREVGNIAGLVSTRSASHSADASEHCGFRLVLTGP